ncbi:MAG: methyltransferase domain-containing protein [Burkholderiales bacterium]
MSNSLRDLTVNDHYAHSGLAAAILAGLQRAGKKLDELSIDDLAPVDQFHIRGKQSTLELAERAEITAGLRVLDVGGGLGGAARTLASTLNCDVTVLDLTEEYCRVGEMLTHRVGLSERVRHHHGNALELPFPDASFDGVWTQHSSMNIENKPKLYGEIRRVLKTGGRFALHEIMARDNTPIHFPVPWARHAGISFLRRPDEVRALIDKAGFQNRVWLDETENARSWFEKRMQAAATSLPPLGIHLLLGEDYLAMSQNQGRNLSEGRIAVIQAVFEAV